VNIEARSYYYVSEGKLDCFAIRSSLTLLTFSDDPRLVDVYAMDDRTSDASDLTSRRADFRQGVIARDSTCVITGQPPNLCDACHIVPHSKGNNVRPLKFYDLAMFSFFNKYMSNAVRHRGGTDDPVNNLNDIDDIRNGLLLNKLLHVFIGTGESAFLMV
jgi:hypothetical protein